MNRLWVRLSMAFTAVFLLSTGLIVAIIRVSTFGLQSPLQDPPAEVVTFFEQVRAQSIMPNPTGLLLVVGLVAIVAGVLMSRSLTAPLAELARGARAIGRQELGQRINARGSEEMVEVATAFNDMASHLQQIEQQRQSLLADVAHELRHPVHVLQGNLQAMLDGVYPRDDAEIERLIEQTRQLAVLINDLHILAQAEARQLPLNLEPADVAELVKEVAAGYQPLAQAQEKTLTVELLGTMPSVRLDRARFRQAIQNLLENGLRHTEPGGMIRLRVVSDQKTVTIEVSDNGEGLSAEQVVRVYDRFYRVDTARARDGVDNTGLGLAIVRAIAEMHGGTATASSLGLGQGSTFTLRLPL